MDVTKNINGYEVVEFKDSFGAECSIQISSSVSPHIWMGVDRSPSGVNQNVGSYNQMHLSPLQAAEIAGHLYGFYKNGSLAVENSCYQLFELEDFNKKIKEHHKQMSELYTALEKYLFGFPKELK